MLILGFETWLVAENVCFCMYFTYLQKSQFCQKCHDTLALSRRYEMLNKLGQK